MLGILFAFFSAASFGVNSAGIRRGVSTGAASQGLYISIFLGVVLFLVTALVTGQLFQAGRVTAVDYGFMVSGGIVHIMIGRYCNYRAVAAIGANRAAPIVGTSTLISVIVAVLFLSETITALKAAGILLVIVGPALVARPRRSRIPAPVPSGAAPNGDITVRQFQPRMVEGYAFGVLAALFWGVGPDLMRAGVSSNGLGILGGLVSYAAASIILAVSLLLPGQMAGAISLDKGARRWFMLGGVGSYLANVFRYSALALAPVSLVIPLMRTSSLFALGFNFLFNRHLESFEPRVLLGILVSLIGATILVA